MEGDALRMVGFITIFAEDRVFDFSAAARAGSLTNVGCHIRHNV